MGFSQQCSFMGTGNFIENIPGTLWLWGINNNQQLGLGHSNTVYSPVQFGSSTDWISVSTGSQSWIGIKTSGDVYGVGANLNGPLGTGNTNAVTTPTLLTTNGYSVSFSGFSSHIVKTDGSLWAAGLDAYNELGNGSASTATVTTREQITTSYDWKGLCINGTSGGEAYTKCAIKANGTLWRWGRNTTGLLATGDTVDLAVPTQYGTSTDWVYASSACHTATEGVMFAVNRKGALYTCGITQSGAMGTGNNTQSTSNSMLMLYSSGIRMAKYNSEMSVLLTTSGDLYTCGGPGALGDGTSTRTSATWVQIMAGTKFRYATTHDKAFFAITYDGKLYSWGNDMGSSGVLGLGTTTQVLTPTQVNSAGPSNWVYVENDYFMTVAIRRL